MLADWWIDLVGSPATRVQERRGAVRPNHIWWLLVQKAGLNEDILAVPEPPSKTVL